MEEAGAASVLETLAERIEREVVRIAERWTEADARRVEAAFEAAARAALRAPALERSLRLRRVARHVVPGSARPALRRFAARLDAASRRIDRVLGPILPRR